MTVTLTTATAERLQRAAEALHATPEALAERILCLVLASCDPERFVLERSVSIADLQDLRWAVLDATKGEPG